MLVSVGSGRPLGQSSQQGEKIVQEWEVNPLPIACHFILQDRELQWEKKRFHAYRLPLCFLTKNKKQVLFFSTEKS